MGIVPPPPSHVSNATIRAGSSQQRQGREEAYSDTTFLRPAHQPHPPNLREPDLRGGDFPFRAGADADAKTGAKIGKLLVGDQQRSVDNGQAQMVCV